MSFPEQRFDVEEAERDHRRALSALADAQNEVLDAEGRLRAARTALRACDPNDAPTVGAAGRAVRLEEAVLTVAGTHVAAAESRVLAARMELEYRRRRAGVSPPQPTGGSR
jgi:hypothetical protein